jgi:DNA polymerase III gamma/tau subunit
MHMHEQVAKCCLVFEFQGNRLNSSLPLDQALVDIRLGQELAERTTTDDDTIADLVDEDDLAERRAREEAEQKAKEEAEAAQLKLEEEKKAQEEDIMASLYADMGVNKDDEEEEESVELEKEEPQQESAPVQPNTTSTQDWAPVLASTEKFYVVETGVRGISSTPNTCLPGRKSHVSVQRVMVEHYSPFNKRNEHSAIPQADRLSFGLNRAVNRLDRKGDTLHLLETVRKTLNLVRPFTFH